MNTYRRPCAARASGGEQGDAAKPLIRSMDVANDSNGVNSNGTTGQTSRAGFDELPYFQEYLQTVLRPRIERAIEALDRSLTEAAWRHIIATVATDQHIAPEVAGPMLRPLLEQKLGLKMQARLESQFSTPGAAAPAVDMGEGMTKAGGDGPEVLTVRRKPVVGNPLVNAVMGNPRPVVR